MYFVQAHRFEYLEQSLIDVQSELAEVHATNESLKSEK